MKRFLLPLLTALALPTAVSAETWHLLVKGSKGAMVTVPMKSEEQCEQAGKEVTTFKEWEGDGVVLFIYNCIKGKWLIMYVIAITYGVVSLLLLGGFAYLTFKLTSKKWLLSLLADVD